MEMGLRVKIKALPFSEREKLGTARLPSGGIGVGQNYDDDGHDDGDGDDVDDGDDDADGKTFNVDIKGVAPPVEWVNSRGEER